MSSDDSTYTLAAVTDAEVTIIQIKSITDDTPLMLDIEDIVERVLDNEAHSDLRHLVRKKCELTQNTMNQTLPDLEEIKFTSGPLNECKMKHMMLILKFTSEQNCFINDSRKLRHLIYLGDGVFVH